MHCLDACLKQQSMPTPLAVFELSALLILSLIAYLSIFGPSYLLLFWENSSQVETPNYICNEDVHVLQLLFNESKFLLLASPKINCLL